MSDNLNVSYISLANTMQFNFLVWLPHLSKAEHYFPFFYLTVDHLYILLEQMHSDFEEIFVTSWLNKSRPQSHNCTVVCIMFSTAQRIPGY